LTRKRGLSLIRQHDTTESHRSAKRFCVAETTEKLDASAAYAAAVEQEIPKCWMGRVPQLDSWVDVWAACSDKTSFRKLERVGMKKGVVKTGMRKQYQKQTGVIAECVKKKMRKELRAATAIGLSVDGRGKYKIWRYRCDTHAGLTALRVTLKGSDIAPCVANGVLGVMDASLLSFESAEEDHAARNTECLTAFLQHVFTPLGQDQVAEDFHEFCKKVRCIAADGGPAERRAIFDAIQKLCPGVAFVIRDVCHAVRIAAKKPLHLDQEFGQVWEELFGKSHALVPDIQYSDKYQAILQGAQEHCLRIPGVVNSVDIVLKHLAFAKQRFDSFATPAAKLAIMLLPVAMMLSLISSDQRVDTERRTRALNTLKLLSASKFCTALGLEADYGLLVINFLRKFDCGNHDIACSARELDDFVDMMTASFKKGWLWSTTIQEAGVTARVLRGEFVSDIVRKQIEKTCIFKAATPNSWHGGRARPTRCKT